MTEAAERTRPLAGLAMGAAVALVLLSIGLYVAFDRTACPGGDGPRMAEASGQAVVCGVGDFYPWASVVWVLATVGGVVAQLIVLRRVLATRQQLVGFLLPLLLPVVLFFVLQAPPQSCTDETRRTEPPERCAVPD